MTCWSICWRPGFKPCLCWLFFKHCVNKHKLNNYGKSKIWPSSASGAALKPADLSAGEPGLSPANVDCFPKDHYVNVMWMLCENVMWKIIMEIPIIYFFSHYTYLAKCYNISIPILKMFSSVQFYSSSQAGGQFVCSRITRTTTIQTDSFCTRSIINSSLEIHIGSALNCLKSRYRFNKYEIAVERGSEWGWRGRSLKCKTC